MIPFSHTFSGIFSREARPLFLNEPRPAPNASPIPEQQEEEQDPLQQLQQVVAAIDAFSNEYRNINSTDETERNTSLSNLKDAYTREDADNHAQVKYVINNALQGIVADLQQQQGEGRDEARIMRFSQVLQSPENPASINMLTAEDFQHISRAAWQIRTESQGQIDQVQGILNQYGHNNEEERQSLLENQPQDPKKTNVLRTVFWGKKETSTGAKFLNLASTAAFSPILIPAKIAFHFGRKIKETAFPTPAEREARDERKREKGNRKKEKYEAKLAALQAKDEGRAAKKAYLAERDRRGEDTPVRTKLFARRAAGGVVVPGARMIGTGVYGAGMTTTGLAKDVLWSPLNAWHFGAATVQGALGILPNWMTGYKSELQSAASENWETAQLMGNTRDSLGQVFHNVKGNILDAARWETTAVTGALNERKWTPPTNKWFREAAQDPFPVAFGKEPRKKVLKWMDTSFYPKALRPQEQGA